MFRDHTLLDPKTEIEVRVLSQGFDLHMLGENQLEIWSAQRCHNDFVFLGSYLSTKSESHVLFRNLYPPAIESRIDRLMPLHHTIRTFFEHLTLRQSQILDFFQLIHQDYPPTTRENIQEIIESSRVYQPSRFQHVLSRLREGRPSYPMKTIKLGRYP